MSKMQMIRLQDVLGCSSFAEKPWRFVRCSNSFPHSRRTRSFLIVSSSLLVWRWEEQGYESAVWIDFLGYSPSITSLLLALHVIITEMIIIHALIFQLWAQLVFIHCDWAVVSDFLLVTKNLFYHAFIYWLRIRLSIDRRIFQGLITTWITTQVIWHVLL